MPMAVFQLFPGTRTQYVPVLQLGGWSSGSEVSCSRKQRSSRKSLLEHQAWDLLITRPMPYHLGYNCFLLAGAANNEEECLQQPESRPEVLAAM